MSREVTPIEDGLVDPIEQLLILDAEIDPDRFMFEGVPMDRSPEFSIGELCKVFFARTDYWLRWREREGAFLLDGVSVSDRRTTKGARVWNLAEVEQMLHAACRNEVISGVQLYAGLKIARAIAVNYKLLTAAPVKENKSMDRVIYKYAIEPGPARDEVGELDGAVVLAGPDNRGIPCVWIEGDPDAQRRDRTFALVGTGGLIPEGYEHRGSFFDLPYVWHVYEKVSWMASAAKIIADSISATTGERLTTMEVVTHRFVLAEFNTHRVFSRNSASSRAIPVAKMLERVIADPALPLSWPREQSGMQGGDELSPAERADAEEWWLEREDLALDSAKGLVALGVHKSVVNRLLEPFLWHTIIVSSTEWENFFAQRCSPLAQPEIRVTAELMREALDNSEPVKLAPGDWHLPYITAEDLEACMLVGADPRQVSVARCARVSYLTHDGVRNPKVDVGLYIKLCSADPPHWSPLEHVATPTIAGIETPGNFTGWDQLRHYAYNGSN